MKFDNNNWRQTIMAAGLTLSGWVAGPIIVGLLIGDWIDRQFSTNPWGLLASLVVAFIVSNVGIARQGIKWMKEIEQSDKEKKELKDKTDNVKR